MVGPLQELNTTLISKSNNALLQAAVQQHHGALPNLFSDLINSPKERIQVQVQRLQAHVGEQWET